MTLTSRIKKALEHANVLAEVLDARDPIGSRCNARRFLRDDMGYVIVLNKCDLVPRNFAEEWAEKLSEEAPTVYVSAKYRLGTGKLRRLLKDVAPELPARACLIGYPNVGKSSLINVLVGRRGAGTAPIPGYTKGVQWIRVSRKLYVLDTPGIVMPEDEDELVIRGALRVEKIDNPIRPAIKLINRILSTNPDAFRDRYGIESKEPMEILRELASKRRFVGGEGELDLDRAARTILWDWQRGYLNMFKETSLDEIQKSWRAVLESSPILEDLLEVVRDEELMDAKQILWRCEELIEYVPKKAVAVEKLDGVYAGISVGERDTDQALKKIRRLISTRFGLENPVLVDKAVGKLGNRRIVVALYSSG